MLTGEPIPVEVTAGDEVIGATLNTTGTFVMRATRVGATPPSPGSSTSSSAPRAARRPIQRLADRIAEVFVPVVLVVAAGDVRRLARVRPGAAPDPRPDRVHRRRRHRLPVRDGPRHADRDHGRDGPRRRGRDPHPRRRGARDRPPRRHRRLRQDRHADARPPDGRRRRASRPASRHGAARPGGRRSSAAASTRSGRRSWPGRTRDELGFGRVSDFAAVIGGGVDGRRRDRGRAATRRRRQPPPARRRAASTSRRSPSDPTRPPAAAGRSRWSPSTAALAGLDRHQRPGQGRGAPRGRASCAAAGIDVWLVTGDARADRRGRRRARSGSRPTRSSPRSCRPTRPRSSSGSRRAAGPSRWSATGSTTRPRSPGPTSGSRSAPAPTSRSRRPDVTLVGGDPRGVPGRDRPVAGDDGGRPPEPVLGLRLQRRPHPGRDGRR